MACIYTFVQEKYDQIFGDISWDVDEKNPKFDGQRPPTPVGASHFDNSCQLKPPSGCMNAYINSTALLL